MHAAALLVGALTPFLALAQRTDPSKCVKSGAVHFVGVRGHGGINPPDPDAWNNKVLGDFRDELIKQIPGSDAVAIPYDYNFPFQTYGILDGQNKLTSYVQDYVSSCPDSKIAVLGFSQGAMVLMNTLCGGFQPLVVPTFPIDQKYTKNIIANLLWGDESRYMNEPWNVGSCPQQYSGQFSRWNSGSCTPWGQTIQSYCDTGDEYCCYGPPANTGYVHAQYTTKYRQAGIDFVKKRIADVAAGKSSVVVGTNGPSTLSRRSVATLAPDAAAAAVDAKPTA